MAPWWWLSAVWVLLCIGNGRSDHCSRRRWLSDGEGSRHRAMVVVTGVGAAARWERERWRSSGRLSCHHRRIMMVVTVIDTTPAGTHCICPPSSSSSSSSQARASFIVYQLVRASTLL